MKRPKTSSKKMSWFNIAGVFLLAVALAVGVTTSAQAASGSFDRDTYLPDLTGSSGSDYDHAWITVTDTSITSTNTDTITVSIKAGSNSTSFILKETGATTTVFTTTGSTQPLVYPVGTTSGYVEDFGSGSHLYPGLGASVVGLDLRSSAANNGGDASAGTSGDLTVSSGQTLELLYSGSTLDTAPINYNSGSFSFTPSAVSAVSSSDVTAASNLFISITDHDENLNPQLKDVIGFADGVSLLGSSLTAIATGTSRAQIEVIDQTTGTRLTNGVELLTKNIMLVESGKNTGKFVASGKVYGTSSTVASTDLKGNVVVGSSTTSAYSGGLITLGNTTSGTGPGAIFRILETNATGSIALVYSGPTNTGFGTVTLAYVGDSTPADASFTGYGTSSLTLTRVVAGTSSSTAGGPVSLWGTPNSGSYATSSTKLVKLIDGSNYCLVEVFSFLGTDSAYSTTGSIYAGTNITNGGSVSVSLDNFFLVGARSGDSLKVTYLDELQSTGGPGSVTSSLAYGAAGETGALSVDKTTADINDYVVVTVTDGNLNTSSAGAESVAASSSLWGGTTTNNRGDLLTVGAYTQGDSNGSGNKIYLSHKDGFGVGTQTIRISNTDNSLVWMVPSSLTGTFKSPLTALPSGSTSVTLGTQSVSDVPLIRGTASNAKSFLSSASTSQFVATLNGLDNTLEISPDGTRWISVPIVEAGANSSSFVGTIGFDFTAVRVTTDSSSVNSTSIFSDATGTSSITISGGPSTLSSVIGTGTVVRISDGLYSEIREVTSVSGSTLSVDKMSNTSYYTPWKTWIQALGDDMNVDRLDTLSTGSVIFRVGGYYGATYRIRYNDVLNASSEYKGGDTLAVTTTNVGFTTTTGSLSVSPSGTVGLNSQIVVTLVDNDLNTSTGSKQTTMNDSTWTSFSNPNENGLGNPVGTSSSNTSVKNGKIAKMLLVSRGATSVTGSGFASTSNTVPIPLIETDNNTGSFVGTLQLSNTTSTTPSATVPTLKVSNGDTIAFFYNDSPNGTAEDNMSSYTTVSIQGTGGLGSLNTSKTEAYLSGDNVVVTLIDNDLNTSSSVQSSSGWVKVFPSSDDTSGAGKTVLMTETSGQTGTFLGTFITGASSSSGSVDAPTVRSVANGTITVKYSDASPAQDVTTNVATKNFGAALAFSADSVAIEGNAVVSLYDPESNTAISSQNNAVVNVKSTTDSTGTTLRLTETGNDTGSFLGTIAASTSSSLANSRIKAAVGDTLTATFTDNPDGSGSISTVTDTASVTAAVTPSPTPTTTATTTPGPSPTPTTTATTTPGPSPLPTLSPFPTGLPSPLPTLSPFPTGLPSPLPTLSPVPTTTPTVCEAENIAVSPSKLTLKKKKSGTVTVTVTGDEGCAVEGETVTVTLTSASKKRVSVTPTSTSTDASGQATFTITAKKKTGNARVTFKAGSVKKSITVKVK